MRRLLVLLIALLLLPTFAMGDGEHAVSVTWQAEAEGLAAYLEAIGAVQEDRLPASSAAALMNSLSMHAAWQEDFSRGMGQLCLGDKAVVIADWQLSEKGLLIGSNLIPGVALTLDAQTMEGLASEWRQMAEISMPLLFENVRSEESYGTFVGDAYAGGVRCETIRASLDRVAAGCHIILRLVYDVQDRLCGVSGTLLDGSDAQLMTLSIGMQDEHVKAVLGFGMNGDTWFIDTADPVITESELRMTLTCRKDPQALGYAAAANDPSAQVGVTRIEWRLTGGDEELLWHGEIVSQATGRSAVRSVFDGSLAAAPQQLNERETVYVGDTQAFAACVADEPMTAQWPDHTADVTVDLTRMNNGDDLAHAMEQGADQFIIDLIKNLPPDVLLLLFR